MIYEKSINIKRNIFNFNELRIFWRIGKVNASKWKKIKANQRK